MASSWVLRLRTLPGLRYEKVTVRLLRETMRLIGDGDLKDIGCEGCEGGMSIGIGQAVHVPGGARTCGLDPVKETGVCPCLVFEDGSVDR